MKVVLFKTKGFVQSLIKWQTRSKYSHAAILTSDGVLIESTTPGGVRAIANWKQTPDAELFGIGGVIDFVPVVTDKQENSAIAFLSAQIGKPYDYLMVARFVSRLQESRRSSGKWFCSELVFAALQKAGITLLRDTEPWEVSPGLLARSPLLIPL